MNEPVKQLCGCALSATFPFCDGNHFVARGRDPRKLQRCGMEAAPTAPSEAKPPRAKPRKTLVSA